MYLDQRVDDLIDHCVHLGDHDVSNNRITHGALKIQLFNLWKEMYITYFSNLYIVVTWRRKPFLFQGLKSWLNTTNSFKYQWSTTSGYNEGWEK